MSLVHYTDKVLHQPCIPFNFDVQLLADTKKLAEELMLEKNLKNGYGLAAPQIGDNQRVFAFLNEVAFNPEVLEESSTTVMVTEGCLSYPNLWVTIKRPQFIKVRYQTENQEVVERELTELETRVFLHELDHLDGITMIDRASDLKLRRAIEQANKHGSKYSYVELRKKI